MAIPAAFCLRCYNAAMPVSDEQIISALTEMGTDVSEYFLWSGGICHRSKDGQVLVLLIEDEELWQAAVDYLRRIGAEERD
jgi:hypothetical protein